MSRKKKQPPALFEAARQDAAKRLEKAGWVRVEDRFGTQCWRAPDGSVLTEDTALARLRDERGEA